MAKRRPVPRRSPIKFGREEDQRDGNPRIAIVCEGSCTEPNYFESLKQEYRLPSVQIYGAECSSDPLNVVRFALQLHDKIPSLDKIFCVVDRDEHETFGEAISLVQDSSKSKIPIQAIVSFPCFEFWYLLHFEYSRAPVVRSGGRSPGGNMLRKLKTNVRNYEKSRQDMWVALREYLPIAEKNGRMSLRDAKADGEPNPSTEMHLLIGKLRSLAPKK